MFAWKQLAVTAVFLVALWPSHQARSAATGEMGGTDRVHHVVMHVNSGEENVQRGAVNNIRHLYQELGRERLQLELVVHGAGLSLFLKNTTTLGRELTQLKIDFGVNYTACSNTMQAMRVGRDDLISEVDSTVPAMVRLMERQEQGWVYIKP